MDDLFVGLKLTTITCYKCQMTIYVTPEHKTALKNSHDTFYCPNGHAQHYVSDSENDKLRKRISQIENRLRIETEYKEEYRDKFYRSENSKRAIKGHHTRLKNRIKAGVCPCCNRTFKNLANHMKNQHPDYTKTTEQE